MYIVDHIFCTHVSFHVHMYMYIRVVYMYMYVYERLGYSSFMQMLVHSYIHVQCTCIPVPVLCWFYCIHVP